MSKSDLLLSQFKIKNTVFRNRIMSTAHAPALVTGDNMPGKRYQLYHQAKARGGIALTMFGGSSNVAPDSPSIFGQIDVGVDRVIPYFQELSERMHKHGTKLMIQLTHMGRRTMYDVGHWLPPIAPSRVRERAHRAFPKEMDHTDIKRVVQSFGEAARRCELGGLDGAEINASSHLAHQFFSPFINKRTDEYGGSLENRVRFCLEVMESIRKNVGDDFILGVRMTGDEMRGEYGMTKDECLEIARILADTGMVDFLNMNAGDLSTHAGLAENLPNMSYPLAPYVELAGEFRREIGLPIFHAARINDLSEARRCIRDGLVDMVGMTRGHMADPNIVRKLEMGEEDNIRNCVGAAYCIDRIYVGNEALCIQNPATTREETLPHDLDIQKTEGEKKKVVVIGGGPGGLEAARVCAARGHDVTLFEATDSLGGQVTLASKLRLRRDLIGITDWLSRQVTGFGVKIHTSTFADAEMVLEENPDVVIVATGGIPDTDATLRSGGEHVVSSWDILSGNVQPADHVIVYDDHGNTEGPTTALFLAEHGAQSVEIITPDRMVAEELGSTTFPGFLSQLHHQNVRITTDHEMLALEKTDDEKLKIHLRHEYSNADIERIADQVVVIHGTIPQDDIFLELRSDAVNNGVTDLDAFVNGTVQHNIVNPKGKYELYRVGDAVASRNIHAAIFDSLRICKDM